MRPRHFCDRFNNFEVSNGAPPFSLFRGRRGGAALRASGRAPRDRPARAVAANTGPGEGTRVYAVRPATAGGETERGGKTVLERCAPPTTGSRGGEAARRAGGDWQGGYAARRICRSAFVARGGARLDSPIPTPAAGRGVGTASHAVQSADGSRSIGQARRGVHFQPGSAGRRR